MWEPLAQLTNSTVAHGTGVALQSNMTHTYCHKSHGGSWDSELSEETA
ncbi:hypothetical protein LEMLEM_LOCUS22971, partial [Lemmus lemmus]